jgi:hypothetical protein
MTGPNVDLSYCCFETVEAVLATKIENFLAEDNRLK